MIKNIVFDFGNVIFKYAPLEVTEKIFPEHPDPKALCANIFKSQTWFDLNLGKISEDEAIIFYHTTYNISIIKLKELMFALKESLEPMQDSVELFNALHNSNKYYLYAITDNVKEIISYLMQKHCFLDKFLDIIVSADLGVMKPSPLIYQHLIDKYALHPEETVFLDDYLKNVTGALDIGMHAIHFSTAIQCRKELTALGVVI